MTFTCLCFFPIVTVAVKNVVEGEHMETGVFHLWYVLLEVYTTPKPV